MTEIRRMRPEDLDRVAEIEKKTFSMPWSKKGFEDSLNADNTVYLTAVADGKTVGYCGFLRVLDEAEITNVAVEREARGRGIGFQMLTELLKCAKECGVSQIFLEVRKSNTAARKLYEKAGFQEESIRKNFYEHPREDAVVMWKR